VNKTKLLTLILAVVFVLLGKLVTQRFGGWKNFTFTRHKFLLKEWLKSVLNYRSYPKNKTGYPFFGPPCSVRNNEVPAIQEIGEGMIEEMAFPNNGQRHGSVPHPGNGYCKSLDFLS